MQKPTIAIVSFPGNNCEVESLRAIKRCGMKAVFFKWNDPHEDLKEVDGYFIPGGFSYEDRGRAGMVAARDPLLAFIAEEAERGKAVIGNCNGAQVLVESGLIPLDHGLKMSLARNVVANEAVGFLNEWVWISPTCARDRCATSDWEGAMHLPIAHGEGRFTTKDKEILNELKKNDQLAFSYCDQEGKVSADPVVTPNGSVFAIAGICNPAGNVVALMPHPERTANGDAYFYSMKRWIEMGRSVTKTRRAASESVQVPLPQRQPKGTEIFIDTIIVNNEERTVEQALRTFVPEVRLKQLKYLSLNKEDPREVLSMLAIFNPNKEIAFIRRGAKLTRWNHDTKTEEEAGTLPLEGNVTFLRRDEPDTGASAIGSGAETGVCYVCGNVEQEALTPRALEIFCNPHASTLERMY